MGYKIKRFSYIQKQKEYGLGDVAGGVVNGVRDFAGNVIEGAGKVADSGVGKLAGAGIGLANMSTGASLGASLGSIAGPVGTFVGGTLGALASPFVGAKLVEAGGKTLKSIGQDIHS